MEPGFSPQIGEIQADPKKTDPHESNRYTLSLFNDIWEFSVRINSYLYTVSNFYPRLFSSCGIVGMKGFSVHHYVPEPVMNAAIMQAGYLGESSTKPLLVVGSMTDSQLPVWKAAYPNIPFERIEGPRPYMKGSLNIIVFNKLKMKDLGFKFDGYYYGHINSTHKKWQNFTSCPLKT